MSKSVADALIEAAAKLSASQAQLAAVTKERDELRAKCEFLRCAYWELRILTGRMFRQAVEWSDLIYDAHNCREQLGDHCKRLGMEWPFDAFKDEMPTVPGEDAAAALQPGDDA
jgi:hypothetical protein